jgi:conjugal transfer pilus assembly protein TraW
MVNRLKPLASAIALSMAVISGYACAADLPLPGEGYQVPSEHKAALADMINQAHTQAREKMASGDLDWIDAIADTLDLTQNPLKTLETTPAADEQPGAKHPLGEGIKRLIFVSWSMGEPAIRQILELYDGAENTAVIFRGVPTDRPFAQAVMQIQSLSLQTESSLTVLIDPTAFQKHSIASVPSVAIETEAGNTLVKASGTFSLSRLDSAVEEGREGDIGQLGPSQEILEPDLIEVAQQRAADLDFDAMKERAIDRFWHNHPGNALPVVQEDAQRYVDPTIVIHADILDAEGNVVTPAGRINPLDMVPFDQKLVIIDPSLPWQVKFAADELQRTDQHMRVTVMASEIAPDRGWDLFNDTQDAISAALYLLPPSIAERFQIQRTPSVVTANNTHFIVQEVSKATAEDGHDVQ